MTPRKPQPLSRAQVARLGGLARAKKLTRDERSDQARRAVMARWTRHRDTLTVVGGRNR